MQILRTILIIILVVAGILAMGIAANEVLSRLTSAQEPGGQTDPGQNQQSLIDCGNGVYAETASQCNSSGGGTTGGTTGGGGTSSIQPNVSYCRLGVTTDTNGETFSLDWDDSRLRGYMNDNLARRIQDGPAYCRTEFNQEVTLYIDAIATTNGDSYLKVDNRIVRGGNGVIYRGKKFEFVYGSGYVSSGHAFLIQN